LEDTKLFGSELIVYDKHNRCLLTDGDYELVLQEVQANVKGSPKKLSSWETIGEIKEVSIFSPPQYVKLSIKELHMRLIEWFTLLHVSD
jgi:polycomb protein SUZ12